MREKKKVKQKTKTPRTTGNERAIFCFDLNFVLFFFFVLRSLGVHVG